MPRSQLTQTYGKRLTGQKEETTIIPQNTLLRNGIKLPVVEVEEGYQKRLVANLVIVMLNVITQVLQGFKFGVT